MLKENTGNKIDLAGNEVFCCFLSRIMRNAVRGVERSRMRRKMRNIVHGRRRSIVRTAAYGVMLLVACSLQFSCNPIVDSILSGGEQAAPLAAGAVQITGANRVGGVLTADTSAVTGGGGAFAYRWQAGGADIPGETGESYTVRGADAGMVISCIVTRSGTEGNFFAPGLKVPYTVTINLINPIAGDSAVAVNDTGGEGDTVTLNYTVADAAHYNLLSFSGVASAAIPGVSRAGGGSRAYVVSPPDAVSGVIAITASFEHTDLTPDPIAFANAAPNIAVTFADNGNSFTNAIAGTYSGSGAITYSSSDASVATVNSGGVVAVLKAGATVIAASKAADAVYAAASASYSLTVGKAAGEAVPAPTAFGLPAPGSATVNALPPPSNGQAVEYAVGGAGDLAAASLTWQPGTTFSALASGTDYYVYARSAESANYSAGEASVSAAICFYTVTFDANGASGAAPAAQAAFPGGSVTLPAKGALAKTGASFGCWNTQAGGGGSDYAPGYSFQVTENRTLYAKWAAEQAFPFPFALPVDSAAIVSGITISRSGASRSTTATLEVSNAGDYDSIEWRYGSGSLGVGSTVELDAADFRYNVDGTHNITVVAVKDGVPYSRVVSFAVEE